MFGTGACTEPGGAARSATLRQLRDGWLCPACGGYSSRVAQHARQTENRGEPSAGRGYPAQLQPMEAVVINTGAPVPIGANTVLPLEQAQLEAGYLLFETSIKAGMNIRPKGLDVRKDTPVLEATTRLQLQPMGLLAALGYLPCKYTAARAWRFW
ncbi:MAG: hypothetical protein ACUVSV_14265 [Armatimonadota bacterium]